MTMLFIYVCAGDSMEVDYDLPSKSIKSSPRIANGEPTTPNEFPWIVSLKLNAEWWDNGTLLWSWFGHSCTGSLIRSQKPAAILTAAHCFYDYMQNGSIWNQLLWNITAQF
eukprot:210424_1